MSNSSSSISGPGPLPPTFVSASIAACVQDGRNNPKEFLQTCSSTPPSRLDDDDNCPICLQPLTSSAEAALSNPKCQHIFHASCLRLLLHASHTQCPICRTTWCGSSPDVRCATAIHYTLRELHLNAHFELFWDLSEFFVSSDSRSVTKEELGYLLHTAICVTAHCMQVQRIGSYDWRDPRARGYVLSDPILRAKALEEEARLKEVAVSGDGYEAVRLLLGCIGGLTPQIMEDCILAGRANRNNVGVLVEFLVRRNRVGWEIGMAGGRRMSVEVEGFVREILVRTLEAVLKGVYGYVR